MRPWVFVSNLYAQANTAFPDTIRRRRRHSYLTHPRVVGWQRTQRFRVRFFFVSLVKSFYSTGIHWPTRAWLVERERSIPLDTSELHFTSYTLRSTYVSQKYVGHTLGIRWTYLLHACVNKLLFTSTTLTHLSNPTCEMKLRLVERVQWSSAPMDASWLKRF